MSFCMADRHLLSPIFCQWVLWRSLSQLLITGASSQQHTCLSLHSVQSMSQVFVKLFAEHTLATPGLQFPSTSLSVWGCCVRVWLVCTPNIATDWLKNSQWTWENQSSSLMQLSHPSLLPHRRKIKQLCSSGGFSISLRRWCPLKQVPNHWNFITIGDVVKFRRAGYWELGGKITINWIREW